MARSRLRPSRGDPSRLVGQGNAAPSGLLNKQADAVVTAYHEHGLREESRVTRGDWPTLVLRKPT